MSPFCGAIDTLVLGFWWHIPWVSKPGWIPHLHALLPECNEFLRFTSGAKPADLLMASMADGHVPYLLQFESSVHASFTWEIKSTIVYFFCFRNSKRNGRGWIGFQSDDQYTRSPYVCRGLLLSYLFFLLIFLTFILCFVWIFPLTSMISHWNVHNLNEIL